MVSPNRGLSHCLAARDFISQFHQRQPPCLAAARWPFSAPRRDSPGYSFTFRWKVACNLRRACGLSLARRPLWLPMKAERGTTLTVVQLEQSENHIRAKRGGCVPGSACVKTRVRVLPRWFIEFIQQTAQHGRVVFPSANQAREGGRVIEHVHRIQHHEELSVAWMVFPRAASNRCSAGCPSSSSRPSASSSTGMCQARLALLDFA